MNIAHAGLTWYERFAHSFVALAALLGEMDCLAGEVFLPKEPTRLNEKTGLPLAISYCAQQPWLEHSESPIIIYY